MIIIASSNNYYPDDLKLFVESLTNVGFSGTKIMIVHQVPDQTIDYLRDNGWEVIYRELFMLQHIQRFRECSLVLKDYDQDQVLFLDCADIIFHKNPEQWDLDCDLYLGADGFISNKEHVWAKEHIPLSYPGYMDSVGEYTHLNCGFIYGKRDIVIDFLMDVYLLSVTSKQREELEDPFVYTPEDQMGSNVVAYTKYKDIIRIPQPQDPYIINLAQTPWDGNREYYLYHQYNRIESFFNNYNKLK